MTTRGLVPSGVLGLGFDQAALAKGVAAKPAQTFHCGVDHRRRRVGSCYKGGDISVELVKMSRN